MKSNIQILCDACRNGSLSKIEALLNPRKFFMFSKTTKIDLNAVDSLGETPLSIASGKGYKEIVEFLVAHGADVNGAIRDRVTATPFSTPLYIALRYGIEAIAELLISKGADVNMAVAVPIGSDTESHSRERQIRDDLISMGADLIKAQEMAIESTREYLTPLYFAVDKGFKGITELLIAHGANVNASKKDGTTLLHLASAKGYKEIVELLITNGANVDAKTNKGETPLTVASEAGNKEIGALLIRRRNGVNNLSMRPEVTAVPPFKVRCAKCDSLYSIGEDSIVVTMDITAALFDRSIRLQSLNSNLDAKKDLISFSFEIPQERRDAELNQTKETVRSIIESLKRGQQRSWICNQCKHVNNYSERPPIINPYEALVSVAYLYVSQFPGFIKTAEDLQSAVEFIVGSARNIEENKWRNEVSSSAQSPTLELVKAKMTELGDDGYLSLVRNSLSRTDILLLLELCLQWATLFPLGPLMVLKDRSDLGEQKVTVYEALHENIGKVISPLLLLGERMGVSKDQVKDRLDQTVKIALR